MPRSGKRMARLALRPPRTVHQSWWRLGGFPLRCNVWWRIQSSGSTPAKSQSGKTRHILCFFFIFLFFLVSWTRAPRAWDWVDSSGGCCSRLFSFLVVERRILSYIPTWLLRGVVYVIYTILLNNTNGSIHPKEYTAATEGWECSECSQPAKKWDFQWSPSTMYIEGS